MKSKNLKEFPNSQIHEATLHRHPVRLGNNQVGLLLRSPQADVCIFVFLKNLERISRKSAPESWM